MNVKQWYIEVMYYPISLQVFSVTADLLVSDFPIFKAPPATYCTFFAKQEEDLHRGMEPYIFEALLVLNTNKCKA